MRRHFRSEQTFALRFSLGSVLIFTHTYVYSRYELSVLISILLNLINKKILGRWFITMIANDVRIYDIEMWFQRHKTRTLPGECENRLANSIN